MPLIRRFIAAAGLLVLMAGPAHAFDYWVLALSWSPHYCSVEKNARRSPDQCGTPRSFVVHGLWPQDEDGGSPRNCQSPQRPDAATIRRVFPVMPDEGLIRHEWKAHGTCSGLSPQSYFEQTERAFRQFTLPELPASLPMTELERRVQQANPAVTPDAIAVRCEGEALDEVWLCLDKTSLAPRTCGKRVKDRCRGEVRVTR